MDSQATETLTAEFNRLNISKHDFNEAHEYLEIFDSATDPIIQRALLSSAIIAYSRPFKPSYGKPFEATKSISFPDDLFDSMGISLHRRIIALRDQGLAHSDFSKNQLAVFRD